MRNPLKIFKRTTRPADQQRAPELTPVRPHPVHPDSGHPVQRTGVRRTRAELLRYIPPVAALGIAFVLQTIAITDILGGVLADRFGPWAYMPALLFGLSVAIGWEGGAAYLMDLYDKHLLARDSTWMLRLSMAGYVAVSAAGIHWWANTRGLPTIMSWLFAAMSASALFLWSRGSRWKHREEMRAANQIDSALPRLPISAKVLHPFRWLATLWLISWNPATTTTEARARYQAWVDRRTGRTARTEEFVPWMIQVATESIDAVRTELLAEVQAEADSVREQARADADRLHEQVSGHLADLSAQADRDRAEAVQLRVQADTILADAQRTADRLLAEARRTAEAVQADSRPHTGGQPDRTASVTDITNRRRTGDEPTVEQLADTLSKESPDRVPGRPKALEILRRVHGSCSNDRAIAAIAVLNNRRNGREPGADATEHSA